MILRENLNVITTDKDGSENVFTISYKITFIVSSRFMVTSLSNLVEDITEWVHKVKCKYCGCFLKYKVCRIIW